MMPPANVRVDFKVAKRIKNPGATKEKLAYDPACRKCGERATEGHHIVFKSQRGDDVAENIVPLCMQHHRDFHQTGRMRVRLQTEEIAYVMEKKGWQAAVEFLFYYYGNAITIQLTGEEE